MQWRNSISRMKKVFISFLLLLFCIARIAAQSDSQISQYIFFPSGFNPAAVGETGMIQLVGMNRMDFLMMENGVNTTNFGVNMPFSIGKSSHGVGIRFVNRTLGALWAYQNAYLQYAYKHTTPIGRFSVGFDVGFINSRIDGTRAIPSPPVPDGENEYHQDNDPVIPNAEVSGMRADLNIGAIYSFEGGFVGISATHVTKPVVEIDEFTTDSILRTVHVIGAYEFRIPDTKLTVKPHTLFRTNFVFWDWHMGAIFEYDEKFWGGLSYRPRNTVGVMAGLNVMSGLSVGIAYDLPITRLITTAGSVELVVEYNFEFIRNRHTRRHKSIRIL